MADKKDMRSYLNDAYIHNRDEYSLKNDVYKIVTDDIKYNNVNINNDKYDLVTMDNFVVNQQIINIDNVDYYLHYLWNTGVVARDKSHAIYTFSINANTKMKMFVIDKNTRHSLFVFKERFDVLGITDLIRKKQENGQAK